MNHKPTSKMNTILLLLVFKAKDLTSIGFVCNILSFNSIRFDK